MGWCEVKSPLRNASGQATIEALAGVTAMVVTGMIGLQMLAVGHAASLADGAAQAAAIAAVNGRSADRAARRAMPDWAAGRAEVIRTGGSIRVWIDTPSLIGPVARMLRVSSTAHVQTGGSP